MKLKLKEDLKTAMKAKDKLTMEVIRGILSAVQYEEMQIGTEDLPQEKFTAVLKNEVKKRKEALEFMPASRTTEIDTINQELKIIEKYLPAQIAGAELEKLINDLKISISGANMGLVMKALKDKYFGQYDAKEASELAKKICG